MKNLLFLFFNFFLFSGVYAQIDRLVGFVDGRMVEIDETTGQVSTILVLNNVPSNHILSRVTWVKETNTFWGVYGDGANNWGIFSISEGGHYQDRGSVTVNSLTTWTIEGISYNRNLQKLFISASLNGGPIHNDYCSESYIELDTNNMTGVTLNSFSHVIQGNVEPEADAFTFADNNMMYYHDSQPSYYSRIFQTNSGNSSTPNEVYYVSYQPIGDMAFKDGNVFYTNNNNLFKLDIQNGNIHSLVGTMGTSIQFNGDILRCITRQDKERWNEISIYEKSILNEIKIYPNPAQDYFQFETKADDTFSISIFSLSGILVKNDSYKKGEKINCSELQNGLYLIQIKLKQAVVTKRLLIRNH